MSPAATLGAATYAIGRVMRGSTLLGTCFHVGGARALTCDHVLRDHRTTPRIEVFFEHDPARPFALVDVVVRDSKADVALVQLEADCAEAHVLPVSHERAWGRPFLTFGYLAGQGRGLSETGAIVGPTSVYRAPTGRRRAPGAARIELHLDKLSTVSGLSGAPLCVVLEDGSFAAVGMVSDDSTSTVPKVASGTSFETLAARLKRKLRGAALPAVDIRTATPEAASWAVTAHAVGPSDSPATVRRVRAQVLAVLKRAQEDDDATVAEVLQHLTELRARFVPRMRALDELGRTIGQLRDMPDEAREALGARDRALLAEAAGAVKAVPREVLELLRAKGAAIRDQVVHGYAQSVAEAAWTRGATDNYTLENAWRLLASLDELLELDVRLVGRGVEAEGRAFSMHTLQSLDILIAMLSAPGRIELHGASPERTEHLATLVARNDPIESAVAFVDRGKVTFAAIAGDHLYRWQPGFGTPSSMLKLPSRDCSGLTSLGGGRLLYVESVDASTRRLHILDTSARALETTVIHGTAVHPCVDRDDRILLLAHSMSGGITTSRVDGDEVVPLAGTATSRLIAEHRAELEAGIRDEGGEGISAHAEYGWSFWVTYLGAMHVGLRLKLTDRHGRDFTAPMILDAGTLRVVAPLIVLPGILMDFAIAEDTREKRPIILASTLASADCDPWSHGLVAVPLRAPGERRLFVPGKANAFGARVLRRHGRDEAFVSRSRREGDAYVTEVFAVDLASARHRALARSPGIRGVALWGWDGHNLSAAL